MGANLDNGKQSFEKMICEMETPIKVQFIVWLDEKLAEYKVQGFMNFDSQTIPKWLKIYTTIMSEAGTSLPIPTTHSPQTGISSQQVNQSTADRRDPGVTESSTDVTPSVNTSRIIGGKDSQGTTDNSVEKEVRKSRRKSTKPQLMIKTETESRDDNDEDNDVDMIRPNNELRNLQDVDDMVDDMVNQSLSQSLPDDSEPVRKAYKFVSKPSITGVIVARKKSHLKRPYTFSRPAETIVRPSQATVSPSQPKHQVTDQSSVLYSSTLSDFASNSVSSNQTIFSNVDEYIHFPIGSNNTSPDKTSEQVTIKTEPFESEVEDSPFDNRLTTIGAEDHQQKRLDASFDNSAIDDEGADGGPSGMQDSWVTRMFANRACRKKCSNKDRKYREKIKRDPVRYQEYLKKSRESYIRKKNNRPAFNDLPEHDKKVQREVWRKLQKAHRVKVKLKTEKEMTEDEMTDNEAEQLELIITGLQNKILRADRRIQTLQKRNEKLQSNL